MEEISKVVGAIESFLWGPPLIVLLVGTGLFMTIRQKFVQFRSFGHGVSLISGKYDSAEDEGHITHFQALSTALAATIGVGNIAGVATAIAGGGPGALFWMWVTALVGMSLKFASCTLGVKYRCKQPDGTVRGGPMYFIENGLGEKWKPLAIFFAVATAISAFGIGNMVQANSVADALLNMAHQNTSMSVGYDFYFKLGVGVFLAVMSSLVIVGGIKRIGKVAGKMVPFMTVIYIGGAMVVIVTNIDLVIPAFAAIFKYAFNPAAASGGFAGALVAKTISLGVARGVFSNESGLGSAPIAHAAAKTNIPTREGLVAMIGPFIDTIIVCTMTGLVIVMSGEWTSVNEAGKQLTGAPLTAHAFSRFLPTGGHALVGCALALFSYSTLIGWYYYGETAVTYLSPEKKFVNAYKGVYILVIVVGAIVALELVWSIAGIFNALMAIPNLIALILLAGVVAKEKDEYLSGL